MLRLIPIAHLWGFESQGRDREAVLADVRDRITAIPGAKVNIGQPISHRLDHIMSGVRAQIAVKIFGTDLQELRIAAQDAFTEMQKVPGVVDLQMEPQVEIPQIRLQVEGVPVTLPILDRDEPRGRSREEADAPRARLAEVEALLNASE